MMFSFSSPVFPSLFFNILPFYGLSSTLFFFTSYSASRSAVFLSFFLTGQTAIISASTLLWKSWWNTSHVHVHSTSKVYKQKDSMYRQRWKGIYFL